MANIEKAMKEEMKRHNQKMRELGVSETASCSIAGSSGWYWVQRDQQEQRPMYFNKLQDKWTDSLYGEIDFFWKEKYTVIRKCN